MFDCAVVGGGILGLAVTAELATQGHKVVLFEAAHFAKATSDNSHHVIHGGFRYLSQFDVFRVLESQRDSSCIMQSFPEAVRPLQCFMPLSGKGLKRALPSRCGAMLFYCLGKAQGLQLSAPRVLFAGKSTEVEIPSLLLDKNKGILTWQDGYLADHDLLVKVLVEKIVKHGGVLKELTPVQRIEKGGGSHEIFAEPSTYKSKCLVSCLGPWSVAGPLACSEKSTLVRAFNVVLKRKFPSGQAVAGESAQGRLFFLVPRHDGMALGTGYLEHLRDNPSAEIDDEEVADFLYESRSAFAWKDQPELEDVLRVESGVLPVKSFNKETGPDFWRSNTVTQTSEGSWDVLGAKYTGFPGTATKVARLVRAYLKKEPKASD